MHPSERIPFARLQRIAAAAIDDALLAEGLSKVGLFLMGHPLALETEGEGIFEVADFGNEPSEDAPPIVRARARVDVLTGDVSTEVFPVGTSPWMPTSSS